MKRVDAADGQGMPSIFLGKGMFVACDAIAMEVMDTLCVFAYNDCGDERLGSGWTLPGPVQPSEGEHLMGTCAKKPGVANVSNFLGEFMAQSMDVLGDLMKATATASSEATFASARRLVKLQRLSAEVGLGFVQKVHQYTGKGLRAACEEGDWLPKEARKIIDEWDHMLAGGVKEFARVADKSFDLLLEGLDRIEKEHKKKPAPEKASAAAETKKAPAKKAKVGTKPGVAKKTTRKPAAKSKPAAAVEK